MEREEKSGQGVHCRPILEAQRSSGQMSTAWQIFVFFHNVNILKMYVTTCSSPTNVKVTFQLSLFIYFKEDLL